jgi:hypothetical protein
MAGVVQHCRGGTPSLAPLPNPPHLPIWLAAGQTDNKAQKFDEFGDLAYSDLMARLDNFFVQLMNEPNAKGFIVIYRTRRDLPGLSHGLAMRMKDYLVERRGLPRNRVVAVDGGVAQNLTQELWIVPSGSTPVPRSDARIGYLEDPDTAWKFAESNFLPLEQYRRFGLSYNREAEIEGVEAYANAVQNKQNRLACIIVYAQYNPRPRLVDYSGNYEPVREVGLDPRGTARRQLLREMKILMADYGLPRSRIKVIDGGYRKHRSIEYWIVPEGEPLPIPTPNAFPFARKRRK